MPNAAFALAEDALQSGLPREALKRALLALQICPDATHVMLLQAEAHLANEAFHEALCLANELLAKDHELPGALFVKGCVLYAQGDLESSLVVPAKCAAAKCAAKVSAKQRFKRKHEQVAALQQTRAGACAARDEGDMASARALLEEALSCDDIDIWVKAILHCDLGRLAAAQGLTDVALKEFALAIDSYPIEAYTSRAAVNTKQKQHRDAIKDLKQALKLSPSD